MSESSELKTLLFVEESIKKIAAAEETILEYSRVNKKLAQENQQQAISLVKLATFLKELASLQEPVNQIVKKATENSDFLVTELKKCLFEPPGNLVSSGAENPEDAPRKLWTEAAK